MMLESMHIRCPFFIAWAYSNVPVLFVDTPYTPYIYQTPQQEP